MVSLSFHQCLLSYIIIENIAHKYLHFHVLINANVVKYVHKRIVVIDTRHLIKGLKIPNTTFVCLTSIWGVIMIAKLESHFYSKLRICKYLLSLCFVKKYLLALSVNIKNLSYDTFGRRRPTNNLQHIKSNGCYLNSY